MNPKGQGGTFQRYECFRATWPYDITKRPRNRVWENMDAYAKSERREPGYQEEMVFYASDAFALVESFAIESLSQDERKHFQPNTVINGWPLCSIAFFEEYDALTNRYETKKKPPSSWESNSRQHFKLVFRVTYRREWHYITF